MTKYFKTEKYADVIYLEKIEPFSITTTTVGKYYQYSHSDTIQVSETYYYDRLNRLENHPDFVEITESEYNQILNFKIQAQCQNH